MRNSYHWMKCVLTVLMCVSIIVYPASANAALKVRIEADDTEKLAGDFKTFVAGQGLDCPQMDEFLAAPKEEWSNILDRFAERFGFSPRVLGDILKGRIFLGIGEKMLLLGVTQRNSTAIDAAVAEFKKFANTFSSIEAEINEATIDNEKMTKIFIPGKESIVLAEARGNRLFIALARDRGAIEGLRREFFAGSLKAIAQEDDVYPGVRGEGLIFVQNQSASQQEQSPQTEDIMRLFGANDTSYARLYFEDSNLWCIGYRPEGEGIFISSYVEGPVSQASLAWLPAECRSAGALHYNAAELLPRLLKGEGSIQESVRGALKVVKMVIGGMDIQDDLLAHLGDEIVFGQLPMRRAGGFPLFSLMGLNNIYASIKLKNAAAFEPNLDRLLSVAGGLAVMDTVGGGVRQIEVNGINVRYLKVALGALAPCFAVMEDYLVVTLNVPLMKYLLTNHGSWDLITEDDDFKKQLDLMGGKLTSGFSYQRYYESRDAGGGGTTSVLTSVAVVSILAGMLLPALTRARGEARKASCKSNLKQIGLLCMMYAQDHNDEWPKKLSDLYPNYSSALNIFACPHTDITITNADQIDSATPYVLTVSGRNSAGIAASIAVYEKTGIHDGGSNVLFGDGHVEWVSEFRLVQLVGGQPEAFDGAQGQGREQGPSIKDFQTFAVTEARNLAAKVDLALFPSIGEFQQEGSSNISLIEVRDKGLVSRAKMGHLATRSGNAMSGIAVAAITAAIAIPSLLRSRIAANETAAVGTLKQLTSHEASFRQIDADGNGVKDYWTADVAGFYALTDVQGNKLKFIDIMTARADAAPAREAYTWDSRPASPTPKSGYYYKAMTIDENEGPYAEDPDGDGKKTTNISKFAFCAYPGQHGKEGVRTFIVNEEVVVYGKDTAGKPVGTWPGADPTMSGWAVTD